ncbi:MAG: HAD family hydrolase [Bacilli bacterium]
MIKCVLFDLDGTIIDTEEFTISSKQIEGKKYGYDIKREDVIASLGMSSSASYHHFTSLYGDDFPFEKLRKARKEYIVSDMKKNGIKLKYFAKEIALFCRKNNIKTAICTSTYEENILEYKKYGDIFSYFDYIITGDMVKKGKPDPDIFLLGASKCGAIPSETLVVEDSNTGVEAALKGGFDVIMVLDLVEPKEEYINKVKIYQNLENVVQYLKNNI